MPTIWHSTLSGRHSSLQRLSAGGHRSLPLSRLCDICVNHVQRFSFRLIQNAFAFIHPVKIRLADILDRQIQALVFSIDRQPDVAGQRRFHACLPEDLIADIVLHIGGISVDIAQVQLVKPVIGLAVNVFPEVDLEAITITVRIICHLRQAGIALCGKRDLFYRFAVDRDIDLIFCFFCRICKKIRPVSIGNRDI